MCEHHLQPPIELVQAHWVICSPTEEISTRIQISGIPFENPVFHFWILVTINFGIPEVRRPPSSKSKTGYFQKSRLIVFKAIGKTTRNI
jgi:hypothetical protein